MGERAGISQFKARRSGLLRTPLIQLLFMSKLGIAQAHFCISIHRIFLANDVHPR